MKSDKIKYFVNETYLNEKLRMIQYLVAPKKFSKRLSRSSKWRFDKSLKSQTSGRKKHYALSTKLAAAKLI